MLKFWSLGYPGVRELDWRGHSFVKNLIPESLVDIDPGPRERGISVYIEVRAILEWLGCACFSFIPPFLPAPTIFWRFVMLWSYSITKKGWRSVIYNSQQWRSFINCCLQASHCFGLAWGLQMLSLLWGGCYPYSVSGWPDLLTQFTRHLFAHKVLIRIPLNPTSPASPTWWRTPYISIAISLKPQSTPHHDHKIHPQRPQFLWISPRNKTSVVTFLKLFHYRLLNYNAIFLTS